MKITLPSGKELEIPVGEKIMSSVDDAQKNTSSLDRYFSPDTLLSARGVVDSVLPKQEEKKGYDGDGGLAGRIMDSFQRNSGTFYSSVESFTKPLENVALSTYRFLSGNKKENEERAASFAETQLKTVEVLGDQIQELEGQAGIMESLATKITDIEKKLETETDYTRANALVASGNKLVDQYNTIFHDFEHNMEKHTRLLEVYESIEFPTKDFLTKATELRDNPGKLLPFLSGAVETADAIKLFDTLMRVDAGEETEEDMIILQKYVNETSQESTFGYKVADTFYTSLPFMMEFLATSGIYAAGSKLTREGMTALLKKYAGKKGKDFLEKKAGVFAVRAVGSFGGTVAMTPFASPTNIAAETIKGMTPEFQLGVNEENTLAAQITKPGDSFALALTKGFGKSFVENWSERSGAILSDFVKPAVKEAALKSVFIRTLFNKNSHIPPTALSRFMKEATNRVGWHGIAGEMFEERIGDVMHGILESVGLGEQEFSLPTAEELLVELSAFSITGGMFAAPSLVAELTGGPNTFTVPDDVRASLKEALMGGMKKDVLASMMSESMGIAKEDATAIVENIEYELMREKPDTSLDIPGTLGEVRRRSAERAAVERKVRERAKVLQEQKDIVADISERLGVDVPVEVVDALYEGGEYFKEELAGGRASGAYVPEYNKIFFSKSAATDTTGFHETVHFVLHNFEQFKDVFGDLTVDELYREANDGKEFSEEDIMDLEEKIAYAAGEYFVSQKAKGKLGTFFEKMKIIMMRLLNALNFETSKIDNFFRVLAYGRARGSFATAERARHMSEYQATLQEREKQYSPSGKKVADAFLTSVQTKNVGTIGGQTFVLGTFGESHDTRKQGEKKEDRFPEGELYDTLSKTVAAFRASADTKNYRYDNIAWIANMGNGELRVVYTRVNSRGYEEILSWHTINKENAEKYISTLSGYGIPDGARTRIAGLEDRQSVQLTYRDILNLSPALGSVKGRVGDYFERQSADFQKRVTAGQEFSDDVRSVGRRKKVNSDGTVTLYHGTSVSFASEIREKGLQEQSFLSLSEKETTPHIQQIQDKTVVELRVDPRDVEFSTGTQEVYAPQGLVLDKDGVWKAPQRIESQLTVPFKGFDDMTTKVLLRLEGKTTVSKQFIADLTNNPDVRQAEKNLIRDLLKEEGDTIDVQKFADKVHAQLIPLTASDTAGTNAKSIAFVEDDMVTRSDLFKWEDIVLSSEKRGEVADYDEVVYQSPIENTAGGVHFDIENVPNYFAHVRVEDMAAPPSEQSFYDIGAGTPQAGTLRRILELQSDLMQKGRLESETPDLSRPESFGDPERAFARADELSQLQPYRNTWYQRIVREEVKRAAQDGKTRLQFPAGETAMEIEGLFGEQNWFKTLNNTPTGEIVTQEDLKVGEKVFDRNRNGWIITKVLEDGEFKAVSENRVQDLSDGSIDLRLVERARGSSYEERFNISNKVDTQHRVYKFYEKEVGPFVQKKYGANRITDPQGVEWFEMSITPQMAVEPVVYFERSGEAYDDIDTLAQEYRDTAHLLSTQDTLGEYTKDDLDEARLRLDFMREALEVHRARPLSKYEHRKGEFKGMLPEVTGGEGKGEFARRGDEIVTELGFMDSEEAREAYEDYKDQQKRYKEYADTVRQIRQSIASALRNEAFVGDIRRGIEKELRKVTKKILNDEKIARRIEKAKERGIREGKVIGRREARTEITARLRNTFILKMDQVKRTQTLEKLRERILRREIERVRNAIVKYARETLPKKEQGVFITKAVQAKTQRDLIDAFTRIDAKAEEYAKKEAITELKKRVRNVAKMENVIAVDYRESIKDIAESVNFTSNRPETIRKLVKLREVVEEQKKKGQVVTVPEYLIQKLSILERKNVAQLSISEIENLIETIANLEQIGRTKLRTIRNLYELEKASKMEAIAHDSVQLNKHALIRKSPGRSLSLKERFINAFAHTWNVAQHMDIAITPMDVFFDMLGGSKGTYETAPSRIFKNTVDVLYHGYLNEKDTIMQRVYDLAGELGLNDNNFERIGVHAARVQKDGYEKLMNAGLTEEEISSIELTDSEMKLYEHMREALDILRPKIAEYARVVENRSLGYVENYFSFLTDWDAMSDSEVFLRVGENVQEIGQRFTKNVEKSFIEKRKGTGKQKIKINAMDVFTRHIDNATYMLHLGREVKMLGEIARTDGYADAVGELGQSVTLEYVDLLARKGGKAGDEKIAFLDLLRRNVGIAYLGYKISSALIQTTALGDGASLIGRWAFIGAEEFGRSREVRVFLKDHMPEIRDRAGDDPAYTEFSDVKALKALQEGGYWALKKLDVVAAGSVAWGAYLKYLEEHNIALDMENPHTEAIEYAQRIVRRTQSSGFFKDVPLAISRGKLTGNKSFDKALFQFGSFLLTRWSRIRHDVFRAGMRKGNRARSANILLWVLLSTMAEVGVWRFSRSIIDSIFGDDEEDDRDRTYVTDVLISLFSQVPFISQLVSVAVYKGDPVPSFGAIRSFGEGVSQVTTGQTDTTKTRGLINLGEAFGALTGIGGTRQMTQILRTILNTNQGKDKDKDKDFNFEEFDFGSPNLDSENDFDFETFDFGTGETGNKKGTDLDFETFDFGTGASAEEKKKFSVRDMLHDVLGVQTAHAKTAPMEETDPGYGKTYWVRNNEVNENDLEEMRAILWGEVGDRPLDADILKLEDDDPRRIAAEKKQFEGQMLEAQVIVNTVFNRMDEHRRYFGVEKSATEIVQEPGQYHAFVDPQYKKYKNGELNMKNEAVTRRLRAIDTILAQIRNGTLIENTNGAFYYHHNDDGTITYDDERPLFL